VQRFTFVVQVHPDGIKTLENLSTHERVPVTELVEIGPMIERWLELLDEGERASSAPGGHHRTGPGSDPPSGRPRR
jgi:hypothetical protein